MSAENHVLLVDEPGAEPEGAPQLVMTLCRRHAAGAFSSQANWRAAGPGISTPSHPHGLANAIPSTAADGRPTLLSLRRQGAIEAKAAAFQDALTRRVLDGWGLEAITDAIAKAVGGLVYVAGPDRRARATTGTTPHYEQSPTLIDTERAAGDASPQTSDVDSEVIVPIVNTTDRLGSLIYAGAPLGGLGLCLLERAAVVVALVLVNERVWADAEECLGADLLNDLISGAQRDPNATRRRARALGLNVDLPLRLIVIRPPAPELANSSMVLSRLAFARGGVSSSLGATVVALVRAEVAVDVVDEFRREMHRFPSTVSLGRSIASFANIVDTFQEASRLLDLSDRLVGSGHTIDAEELGLLALLCSSAQTTELVRVACDLLRPLLDQDVQRGTDLLNTVDTYLVHKGNVTRASKALFIHPNTLYQRLEKIDALLGVDWKAPDGSLELGLAIRLYQFCVDADASPEVRLPVIANRPRVEGPGVGRQ